MELTLYGITKEIQVLEELWEMAIDEETGECTQIDRINISLQQIEIL